MRLRSEEGQVSCTSTLQRNVALLDEVLGATFSAPCDLSKLTNHLFTGGFGWMHLP